MRRKWISDFDTLSRHDFDGWTWESFWNLFSIFSSFSQKSRDPRCDSLVGPFEFTARRKTWASWDAGKSIGRAGEEGADDLAEKPADLWAHQGIFWPLGQARQRNRDDAVERKSGLVTAFALFHSKFHPQNEKQKQEEQSKLTNLLEKILSAFESSAQTSSRVSDSSDEDDDGKLAKKIDELAEAVKGLRKEIVEVKAGQDEFKVG